MGITDYLGQAERRASAFATITTRENNQTVGNLRLFFNKRTVFEEYVVTSVEHRLFSKDVIIWEKIEQVKLRLQLKKG